LPSAELAPGYDARAQTVLDGQGNNSTFYTAIS